MVHTFKNFIKIIVLVALFVAPSTGFAMDAADHGDSKQLVSLHKGTGSYLKAAGSVAKNCLGYVAQSASDHPWITLTIGGTATFIVGWHLLIATPEDVAKSKRAIKEHGEQETKTTKGQLVLLQTRTKEKFDDYKKEQAVVRAIRGQAQENLGQAKAKLATFKIDFDKLGVHQSVVFNALKGILDAAAVQNNNMNREVDAMAVVANAVPGRHAGMKTSLAAIVTEIGGAQVDLAQLLTQLRLNGQNTTAIENQLRQLLSPQELLILDKELEALNSTDVQRVVDGFEEKARSE